MLLVALYMLYIYTYISYNIIIYSLTSTHPSQTASLRLEICMKPRAGTLDITEVKACLQRVFHVSYWVQSNLYL